MSPLPVAGYQMLGLFWAILKVALKYPIINKALDNWTKGTANEVDNWVWKWLEKKIGVDPNHAAIEAEVAQLQQKYDEAKAAGIIVSLKEPVRTWELASLVVDGESPNSNIG